MCHGANLGRDRPRGGPELEAHAVRRAAQTASGSPAIHHAGLLHSVTGGGHREDKTLLALGERLQFLQGAIPHDLSPIDDDDTIRDRFHLLQDVGGQQHGFVVRQMADKMPDFENLMGRDLRSVRLK